MQFLIYENRSGETNVFDIEGDTLLDIDALFSRFLKELSCGELEVRPGQGYAPLGCGDVSAYIFDPETHDPMNGTCWESRDYFVKSWEEEN